MKRYAIARNARSLAEAEAYLPENYRVVGPVAWPRYEDDPDSEVETHYVIEGEDVSGWTLDDYVIPRYASGLIWAAEVTLAHPIFEQIAETVGQHREVSVLLNETEEGGRLAIFSRFGDEERYQDGDVLTEVWKGEIFGHSPEIVLEVVFGMFNRGAPDFVGDVVYPHRSLSVGDCVRVDGVLYACESVGWKAREGVTA